MAAQVPFDDFIASLQSLNTPSREDPAMRARIVELVDHLRSLPEVTRESLEGFVALHPDAVPVLGTCAGLTPEQLKNHLSHRLGSAGWVTIARKRAPELIAWLDDEYGLLAKLGRELRASWTYADVLQERYLWSKRTGNRAVGQGRKVEDVVEDVVKRLGLSYRVRTRFSGRGSDDAPCDLAHPEGGAAAQIVVAMKGFNSTGSKLSDAVREIAEMAAIRAPRQYVFAVVDGIGWRNRQADLRRIHHLWESGEIDGLYSLAHLDRFQADLRDAALRRGLVAADG